MNVGPSTWKNLHTGIKNGRPQSRAANEGESPHTFSELRCIYSSFVDEGRSPGSSLLRDAKFVTCWKYLEAHPNAESCAKTARSARKDHDDTQCGHLVGRLHREEARTQRSLVLTVLVNTSLSSSSRHVWHFQCSLRLGTSRQTKPKCCSLWRQISRP